jgi:hypothetical protein
LEEKENKQELKKKEQNNKKREKRCSYGLTPLKVFANALNDLTTLDAVLHKLLGTSPLNALCQTGNG